MHALLAGSSNRLVGGPSDADGKLLECCPFRKQQRKSQPFLGMLGKGDAGLPHLAEPLWAQPREMHQPGKRQKRLVRRDVGRRLLAADVLLTGLQGEDITAFTRDIGRLANDASRHAADVVGARGDEAVVRTSVRLVVARALAFANRKRAAVVSGSLEEPQRNRVDVGRAVLRRRSLQPR